MLAVQVRQAFILRSKCTYLPPPLMEKKFSLVQLIWSGNVGTMSISFKGVQIQILLSALCCGFIHIKSLGFKCLGLECLTQEGFPNRFEWRLKDQHLLQCFDDILTDVKKRLLTWS